jgi:hypothetical protein
MNYKKIYNNTKNKGSFSFSYKGENFKTFIGDWEKNFCLTHYSSTGTNSWAVGSVEGLENKINHCINN